MSGWKYVYDTRRGLAHENSSRVCQDCAAVEEGTLCITAALADGIGSREHSEMAAKAAVLTVCALFNSYRKEELDDLFTDAGSQTTMDTVKSRLHTVIRESIRKTAESQRFPISAMDCTLVFVCIAPNRNQAMIGRIGDSAVCIVRNTGRNEAVCARSFSANQTNTVLEENAARNLELRVLDLSDGDVVGFVLTSDGLDNELYMKGSDWVCQDTQEFLNALCGKTQNEAKSLLSNRIADLTSKNPDFFRDDISYAVLSRANSPVALPPDPTWLCTCGVRNQLWETYCANCHNDFVKVYKNVDFTKEGKAAFFSKLNANEKLERRILGMQTSNADAPVIVRLLISVFLLVLLIWNLWMGYSVKRDIRQLKTEIEFLQQENVDSSGYPQSTTGEATDSTLSTLAEQVAALNGKLNQLLAQEEAPSSESAPQNGGDEAQTNVDGQAEASTNPR